MRDCGCAPPNVDPFGDSESSGDIGDKMGNGGNPIVGGGRGGGRCPLLRTDDREDSILLTGCKVEEAARWSDP